MELVPTLRRIARYDGGILYVDSILGEIFARMRSLGQYDGSLFIVTSDHGEALGYRNIIRGHGGMWEAGLRVPMIVKLPAQHPRRNDFRGAVFEHDVESIDIAPTILDVAGIPVPDSFQGHSMLGERPPDVVASYEDVSVLIRGNHKLMLTLSRDRASLYDLERDPGEKTDLAGSEPELTMTMKRDLLAALAEHEQLKASREEGDAAVELGADDREQLEALGYLATP